MGDVEAVAAAIERQKQIRAAFMLTGEKPMLSYEASRLQAQAAIDTLKSRGWTPPKVDDLQRAMNELASKQQPLGSEFDKAIFSNIEELYEP